MRYTHFIIHYAEIGLKGKNRAFFENKLESNIEKSLQREEINFSDVKRITGRIIIKTTQNTEIDKVTEVLKNIPGVANFSPVVKIETDLEKIKETALKIVSEEEFSSFAIDTRRSNKNFSKSSMEINEEVGALVVDKTKKDVDLEEPDLTIHIEIARKSTFLYIKKYEGRGGLPVTTGGKAVTLLSGGIDSPVASYFIAKRGVKNIFVHFHSYPYTNHSSIDKAREVVSILNKFQYDSKLYLVPFADIQKVILDNTPEPLRILLYRRFMFRIAEKIAQKEKAEVLATGESIGQVSSQTLENIRAVSESVQLPILRPLIGMDKVDIIDIAKDIGTYEISIKPCQDSCTWFMPQNPRTKAKVSEVKNAEKDLSIDDLVKEGLDSTEEEIIQ
ncbi:MAG TPA: tRNA uracil 4-sulfurtransferase ThiI [Candidatus Paceibacterota bacterium]|nr:tRNA uracil 4-sulfurtransferase ThiI [Candidatus Paceibacterota bacterium]